MTCAMPRESSRQLSSVPPRMPTPIAAQSQDVFAIRVEPQQAPAHMRRRGRQAMRLPWLRLGLGSAVVMSVVGYVAYQGDVKRDAPVRPRPQPLVGAASPPAWQPIGNPSPIYALDAPAFKGLPAGFEARRHASGAREDALTYGAFDNAAEAHARLVVQEGDGAQRPHSFFVDLARGAAGAGLAVMRNAQPMALPTKFGTAESAEVVLSAASDRSCQALRLAYAGAEFHVLGWVCGAGGRTVTQRELTCLIDRLALTAAADDAQLKALFAHAETQRQAVCAPPPAAPVRKAAAPARAPKRAHKPARPAEPRATMRRLLNAFR
jgi:hypothetical protein